MITAEKIKEGIERGVVRFVVDPNMGRGTVCEIGENWFYFGGPTAEAENPEEFLENADMREVSESIVTAIEGIRNGIHSEEEYWYYEEILTEELGLGGIDGIDFTCPHCGHRFKDSASKDDIGWHTACPECGGSFDVDVPDKAAYGLVFFRSLKDGSYEGRKALNGNPVLAYYGARTPEGLIALWDNYADQFKGLWYVVIDREDDRVLLDLCIPDFLHTFEHLPVFKTAVQGSKYRKHAKWRNRQITDQRVKRDFINRKMVEASSPEKAYELFKLWWMIQHGHTLSEFESELYALQQEDPEDIDGVSKSVHTLADEWEKDRGFGGEIWPCYEEFLHTEYKEAVNAYVIDGGNA